MMLVQRLQEVQMQEPRMYCGIETTGLTNSLQNAWWAFPEWIHDYHAFGRVPDVLKDGKHVANRSGLPLIS